MSQAGNFGGGGTVSPDVETLTGDAGGAVGADAAFNINLLGGTGINTVGTPGSNQIVFNATGGSLTWTRTAGPAVALVADNGYIPTNVALVSFTLPATAALGTVIKIVGEGAGGWRILQNAGQSIQYGNSSTTVGVTGELQSSNQWDTVKIICRVVDTTWSVVTNVGVLNVV